ncbi:hypothetical protein THAOC_13840, partial [Thalassiosira oceanica]
MAWRGVSAEYALPTDPRWHFFHYLVELGRSPKKERKKKKREKKRREKGYDPKLKTASAFGISLETPVSDDRAGERTSVASTSSALDLVPPRVFEVGASPVVGLRPLSTVLTRGRLFPGTRRSAATRSRCKKKDTPAAAPRRGH